MSEAIQLLHVISEVNLRSIYSHVESSDDECRNFPRLRLKLKGTDIAWSLCKDIGYLMKNYKKFNA